MTGFGQAVDAALEACVVPGFSRIGLAVRSRLLDEFTAGDPPAVGGKTVVITGATSRSRSSGATTTAGGSRVSSRRSTTPTASGTPTCCGPTRPGPP